MIIKNIFAQWRKTALRAIIICIGLLAFEGIGTSHASYVNDSMVIRRPSAEHLKKIKGDSDFNYGRDFKEQKGPIEKLWLILLEKIGRLLEKTNYDNFWKYVYMAVIIFMALLIIKKVYGKEINIFLRQNNKSLQIQYDVSAENIHEMNLDELIHKAIDVKNYRLAIRYQYLKSLKLLTDRNHIDWRPEKTNHVYLFELKDDILKHAFETITVIFENAWYGDKALNEESFESGRTNFNSFYQSILNR